MAITYYGSGSNPADNSALAAPTAVAITPPASMTTNDLVLVWCLSGTNGDDNLFRCSTTGGQSWHRLTLVNTSTTCGMALYACRFNGTWSVNPQFMIDSGSATPMSFKMDVFRPTSTSKLMDIDCSAITGTYTAPGTPFTVTITGVTTLNAGAVAVACWCSTDDNTWDTLTGGWTNPGGATQFRNTTAPGQSITTAYQVFAGAGATGNVSMNQATLGGDLGVTCILSFYERDEPTGTPTIDVATTFEGVPDGTLIDATILTNCTTASPGGTWAFSGTAPANLFAATVGRKNVAENRLISVGGTTMHEMDDLRGMRVNHATQAGASKFFTFVKTSAVNIMSAGCYFKTGNAYASAENFAWFGIVDAGSAGMVSFNTSSVYFDPPYGNIIQTVIENVLSEVPWGPYIQRQTWYWISLLYDYTNNVTKMVIYDPATWAQLGFMAQGRAGSAPGQAKTVNIGIYGGGFASSATHSYWDGLIIDYTDGTFPLFPGPGTVASGRVQTASPFPKPRLRTPVSTGR